MGGTTSHAWLGMSNLWFATILFAGTYLVIMTEKVNRAIVALLGAGLMIISGVLTQEAAVRGVDFNTLGLLTGMMVIVAVTRKSGVFQYVAIWSAKKVNAQPWGILLMLASITALFSALLDNVTTVLLTVPVTLLITEELKVKPYPYLFATIFASNIGGTATLIGDPPNIMIGSAAHLSFNDFLVNLAPVIALIFVATLLPIFMIWRKEFTATEAARQRVMGFDEKEAITNSTLLKQSLFVLALVIGGFVFAHPLGVEPATVALFGAALLLLLDNFRRAPEEQSKGVHNAFGEVEWVTIFFFVGLFVVVAGVEKAGLINLMAHELLAITHGDPVTTSMAVLWGSAILSAVVDNIPYVATMIPLIKSMAPALGGAAHLDPVWWSLSLGACLGGNGSLIGASANLVVAGFADRAGCQIRFVPFLLTAFPLMLMSILISSIYIYWRYLV